jgi:fatty-acid peroxygenase
MATVLDVRPPEGTALRGAADLRHVDGRPVPERVAGVALLNVVPPTIAVA